MSDLATYFSMAGTIIIAKHSKECFVINHVWVNNSGTLAYELNSISTSYAEKFYEVISQSELESMYNISKGKYMLRCYDAGGNYVKSYYADDLYILRNIKRRYIRRNNLSQLGKYPTLWKLEDDSYSLTTL